MKRLFLFSSILLVICGLVITPIQAQQNNNAGNNLITEPRSTVISSLAVNMLQNIVKARNFIQQDNGKAALAEVENAQVVMDMIKNKLPTVEVKTRIDVVQSQLEYTDTDYVKPDLVPLYVSLANVEEYVPTDKTKMHIDKAKEYINNGQRTEASQELTLAEEALVYKEVDLPLAQTDSNLTMARNYLQQGEMTQANQALKDAEKVVQRLSVVEVHPLALAKASLWKALTLYENKMFYNSTLLLQNAYFYLDQARELATTPEENEQIKVIADSVKETEMFVRKDNKMQSERIRKHWDDTGKIMSNMFNY
ncbi:MAG: YfdX family protein [Vulcanimicrobiota bacterium]